MTDTVQPRSKEDPETLVLRAKPAPVVRFKKPVLIGAVGLGCGAIFAVTWLGLATGTPKAAENKELMRAQPAADPNSAVPESVQQLPETYTDVPEGVPLLGEPLPGDLGGPMLGHQRTTVTATRPTDTVATAPAVPGVFFQVSSVAAPAVSILPAQVMAAAASPERPETDGIYNSHSLQTPVSPYQVMAGTVISASLITGLNSDLPGTVIAQTTAPTYDTVTGKILLIPQGSRLLGEYDDRVGFGQSRVLLIWKRLIMPDGSSIEIDNYRAADPQGFSGLADRVDYHTWRLLKGVGLSTLLGLTAYDGANDDSDLVRAFREATRQTANQSGQQLVAKAIDMKPTITVRAGWPVRVIVQKDLILRPYEQGGTPWPN